MKPENYILLVVNPVAGNSDKDLIIDSVRERGKSENIPLEIYTTTGKDDMESIKAFIKKRPPQRILVAGGDGTISMVANCIIDKNICLGIIPAGSANGLAVNFDIPETLPEQVMVAFSEIVLKIDALFLNGNLCLHIADLGINAELIKNYEDGGIRGKFGYFLQSVPTLLSSDFPFQFKVETEEGIIEETGILLAIANANKFGTGATINPSGKINDGKFEILIFKSLDFIEIFKTMQDDPQLSTGFVKTIATQKATIKTLKEVPFQIDGEFLGPTKEVFCEIKKEKLTMVVPEEFFNSFAKQQQS